GPGRDDCCIAPSGVATMRWLPPERQGKVFARWARLVYRRRWIVLAVSILSLCLAIGATRFGGSFVTGAAGDRMEASRAVKLMDQELPSSPVSFIVLFSSKRLS